MAKIMTSLQEASVLRKFSILFLLVSIVPLSLLCLFYFQLTQKVHQLEGLQPALLFTIAGIGVGYFAMRSILKEFIHTVVQNRLALTHLLNDSTGAEGEGNEVVLLTKTFATIKSQLEKDIQRLELNKKTLNSVLTRVSKGIATAKTVENFLQLIIETLTDALLGNTGLILLFDKDKQNLYVDAAFGIKATRFKDLRFSKTSPFFKTALESSNGLVISDLKSVATNVSSEIISLFEFPLLCWPLVAHNEPLGLIVIFGRSIDEPFQNDEIGLVHSVAIQTALTINNEELKQLSILDPLTGLFNYRHLSETLDYEIRRSKRYSSKLCVLMIDLDGFKTYNDTFGHLEGDFLLQQVASLIKDQLRATDTFCRYGGDEFSIVLSQTDIKGSAFVAEKIRNSVELLRCKGKITASVGVASWSEDLDRQALIKKADEALYQAKKEGKNRILVAQ
jgi:diguanylate cyclase (GGDEF)-like protein